MTLYLRDQARGRLLLLATLALAVVVLATLDIGGGTEVAHSADAGWSQVTLLYHSDCRGKIEPCG